MRGSLTISAIAHLVALGMCLVAFAAQPMEAPATPAMTVNTISVKDFTELTKGVKDAPKLKVDDIKPVADKIDTPKPIDEVAPKVADNKPEIKTDTSAKQQPKPTRSLIKSRRTSPPRPSRRITSPTRSPTCSRRTPPSRRSRTTRPAPTRRRATRPNSTPTRSRLCSTSAIRSARWRRPRR